MSLIWMSKKVDRFCSEGYNCPRKLESGGFKLANETGKRYFCAKCNSEFIVTKGGGGAVVCCGNPMQKK